MAKGVWALEIEGLCVQYPRTTRLALDQVTCRIPIGARIALIGSNGAGKSTFIKAIAGLLPASSGTIRVYGQLAGACYHRIAYLPQRSQIDWAFPISVQRLVTTGRYVHLGWLRRPRARDAQLVTETLEQLGLKALAMHQIGQLSGGQQQRVLLARALVQEADLLLLDEPLAAVDVETQEVITNVFRQLGCQGKTLIIATHDHEQIDTEFDGVLHLRDGREISLPDTFPFPNFSIGGHA
ncbi:ABC transporter ATP-binding protein [Candidatus Entotheonella serta]|nr:ABC transporter ATP-binding protein [Candidatus Entotheonella serta]